MLHVSGILIGMIEFMLKSGGWKDFTWGILIVEIYFNWNILIVDMYFNWSMCILTGILMPGVNDINDYKIFAPQN